LSDEKSDGVRIIEAHQELVRHVESGSARIRTLSVITVFVSFILSASYLTQIAYPYVTGKTSVTVDLTSPANVVTELFVLALALAWLYIGVRDYVFSARLSKAIGQARDAEKELDKRITG